MVSYEARSEFLKKTLFNLHNGATALSPLELAQTPVQKPRKAMVVGHCAAADWGFHKENSTKTPVDYVFAHNLQELPARSDEELAQYDFQVIQLPLRFIFSDHCIWGGTAKTDAEMEAIFAHSVARLKSLLSLYLQYNTRTGLLSFVTNFMVPAINPLGKLLPRHDLRNPQYFLERLNQELEALVNGLDNVHVLDVDSLTAFYGKKYFQEDLLNLFSHGAYWPGNLKDESRIEHAPPLHEHFVVAVDLFRKALWMEIIGAWRIAHPVQPVKLIVVDLDDTLWQGTLGDIEAVDAAMVEGWPAGLLEALSYFRDRGGLLAILSRNHRHLVEAAWKKLYGSRFPLENFVAVKCSFSPKSEMMLEILRETGLTARSVLFIDDHPVQRAEIKAAFPEIRVLHGYHYYWRKIVLLAPETQVARLSHESLERSELVKRRIEQQQDLASSLSREEFLQGLGIEVEIRQLQGSDDPLFERSFELLNKTNQFNSTGQRWSRADFTAFAVQQRVFCLSVQDRYAAHGMVGLVLMEHDRIVQFVMSCRVIGLDIERGIMDTLLRQCAERWGMPSVKTSYEDNGVNRMCLDLFTACGFRPGTGGEHELRLDMEGRPALSWFGTFDNRLPEQPPEAPRKKLGLRFLEPAQGVAS